jgi:hypothetical protein
MTEPDVALTDFGLAVECAVFVSLLARRAGSDSPLRSWYRAFFAGVGTAALLGGVLHGYLAQAPPRLLEAVWLAILVASGLAALACWAIGGRLLFDEKGARGAFSIGLLLFALYLLAVLFLFRDFRVVVAHSAAASLFLLMAFLRRRLLWDAAGAGLMLAAGAVQQSGFDLHPVYFTHNALYHVVVGVALFLIFRGAAIFDDRTVNPEQSP